MLSPNTLRRIINNRFAAATAASLIALTSSSAMAATICGPTSNISVPDTFDGIYINFLTGATGTTGASTPGWDLNPYNSGTGLSFFWNATPAASNSGVASTTTGPYLALAAGTPVSAASTFANVTATAATSAFKAGVTGAYLGVRFYNESTAAINYGWLEINSTAGTGFPLTIVNYCYQDDGTAITTGSMPVSLQSYSVD